MARAPLTPAEACIQNSKALISLAQKNNICSVFQLSPGTCSLPLIVPNESTFSHLEHAHGLLSHQGAQIQLKFSDFYSVLEQYKKGTLRDLSYYIMLNVNVNNEPRAHKFLLATLISAADGRVSWSGFHLGDYPFEPEMKFGMKLVISGGDAYRDLVWCNKSGPSIAPQNLQTVSMLITLSQLEHYILNRELTVQISIEHATPAGFLPVLDEFATTFIIPRPEPATNVLHNGGSIENLIADLTLALDMLEDIRLSSCWVLAEEFRRKLGKWEHNQIIFPGRMCAHCKICPIEKIRYKCIQCTKYELCGACMNLGTHREHVFAVVMNTNQNNYVNNISRNADNGKQKIILDYGPENEEKKQTTRFEFQGSVCSMCSATPLVGALFRCFHCCDFVLCNICMDSYGERFTHAFILIRDQKQKKKVGEFLSIRFYE